MVDSEAKDYFGYIVIVFGAILSLVFILTDIGHANRLTILEESRDSASIELRLEQPEFLLCGPREGLMDALVYYGIPHPDIVWCQAFLETGNFLSERCIIDNNLFGLYNTALGRYMQFDHWSTSIKAYKTYFSDKWNPDEDYYEYLERIKYAKDSLYVSKVKEIHKQFFDIK